MATYSGRDYRKAGRDCADQGPTDFREPATLLRTNSCSPLVTNALAENIWDNFSPQSYKELCLVGEITIQGSVHREYITPAGGRDHKRPPSLISLWSTAPYLLNNTAGPFDAYPSVQTRMVVFQSGIEEPLPIVVAEVQRGVEHSEAARMNRKVCSLTLLPVILWLI